MVHYSNNIRRSYQCGNCNTRSNVQKHSPGVCLLSSSLAYEKSLELKPCQERKEDIIVKKKVCSYFLSRVMC